MNEEGWKKLDAHCHVQKMLSQVLKKKDLSPEGRIYLLEMIRGEQIDSELVQKLVDSGALTVEEKIALCKGLVKEEIQKVLLESCLIGQL